MRRRFLIVLLAIGTVAGYASGFRSMRHCRSERGWERHSPAAMEAYREGYEKGRADVLKNEK